MTDEGLREQLQGDESAGEWRMPQAGKYKNWGLEKVQMRSKPLRPSQRLAGIGTHKNQEKTGTFLVLKSRTEN
jgi:hypothetical protein